MAFVSFFLAFGFTCPACAAMQNDAGVVDVVKPDAPKPDTPKADSPKPDAATDASKLGEPTDPKARKTYATALDWEKAHDYNEALDSFLKANRQDGGHCFECLRRANTLAVKLDAYKDAVEIARELLPLAQSDSDKANVHFRLATALQVEGIKEKKDQYFQESNNEFKATLDLDPHMSRARYHWGVTLAHLHQDDAARAQFSAFLDEDRKNPSLHERAERFLDRIDLARAAMAPPFMATTLDGQHISLDSLAGKVVLIDFWATWCGPCVNALPHIQHIAHKFDGQPLVVLSVSLDSDEAKWKTFVDKNRMTWMQVRDGGFNGAISMKFGVTAIPATFTIDADGVLEDQHVGDADIEGKLKKLVAHAAEVNSRKPAPVTADASSGSGN
ncbi:MAG: redoxin domain-containing protein [Terracidiphilus sp.]